ncbi:MAG TPA: STAS domain-containing protein [Pseudonocardiaceae bacterium]|nr:STAS domain-containing protein [Pseudonocardiaceae bacterium]
MTIANVSVRADGTSVLVTIAGEIDIDNADDVEQQVLQAIDNRMTGVRLDLTYLDYMDSSGLRILFNLASRLKVLQIDLDVVAPPGTPTRRVLELAGFDAF